MQQAVKGGLDKLFVTFSDNIGIEEITQKLFQNLSIKDFKRSKEKRGYYQIRYAYTYAGRNLVNIYTDPKNSERRLYRNNRNLVAINGLAFSDSALNRLRPQNDNTPTLDLKQLCNAVFELNGHVTQIDAYLDEYVGYLSPDLHIYDFSRPSRYKSHIRSNLIKDILGKRNPPRIVGCGCYYGVKKSTQVLLYQKHLDPHQRVFEEGNAMKHPINRFELRLRKAKARQVGKEIIEKIAFLGDEWCGYADLSVTSIVTKTISDHFAFIEPTKSNKHKAALDKGWKQFIDAGLTAKI